MKHRNLWTVAALALLLSACAGIPQRAKEQEADQRYRDYAGAPVDNISYLGRYDSWRYVGNSQVVVWTTINTPYLLTVAQPCINLQFAQRIGLTSTTHTVSRGFDSVLVDNQRCQITEIRPVDYKALKAAQRESAH